MHPALERKGLIYFAVGELERQNYERQVWDLDHDLMKLSKPNWLKDHDSKPRTALSKAFEITSKVLIQQYDLKKKTDGDGFKHRNWFREPGTLTDIKSGLELALEFGSPSRIWA